MKKKQVTKRTNIIRELNRMLGHMGWHIAIPDKDTVDHLIIGKIEKVEKIINQISGKYDIMERELTND
jgi:Mg2+/Co2+ transporter CorB